MINAVNDSKPQNSSPASNVVKSAQKDLNKIAEQIIKDEAPDISKIKTAVSVASSAKTTPAISKSPGLDSVKPEAKPKKKFNVKMIGGVFILLLIIVGAVAGFYLSQQDQDLRQQASDDGAWCTGNDAAYCPNTLYYADFVNGQCVCTRDPNVKTTSTPNPSATPNVDRVQDCVAGYTGTTGKCVGDKIQRIYRFADCSTETRDNGPACEGDTPGSETRYPEVIPDADPDTDGTVGDSCNFTSDVCAPNLVCHCQDGNACTTRECELPTTTKIPCNNQDRSWCRNEGGQAFTCCAEGYICRTSGPGCVPGPTETTPPTTTPPKTTPPATPPPEEPMCKDVAILDEDNNELDPAVDSFSIGMILKFRCAADDPDSQVTRYRFKITEPDGTVVNGAAINPAGSSATSLQYQIDQYLSHKIQCSACTSDGCQDWVSITP